MLRSSQPIHSLFWMYSTSFMIDCPLFLWGSDLTVQFSFESETCHAWFIREQFGGHYEIFRAMFWQGREAQAPQRSHKSKIRVFEMHVREKSIWIENQMVFARRHVSDNSCVCEFETFDIVCWTVWGRCDNWVKSAKSSSVDGLWVDKCVPFTFTREVQLPIQTPGVEIVKVHKNFWRVQPYFFGYVHCISSSISKWIEYWGTNHKIFIRLGSMNLCFGDVLWCHLREQDERYKRAFSNCLIVSSW